MKLVRNAAASLAVVSIALAGCTGVGANANGSTDAANLSTAPQEVSPPASAAPTPQASSEGTLSPSASGYAAVLPDGRLSTTEICRSYEKRFATYQAAAAKRTSAGDGSTKDPYKAAAYRRNHPWVRDPLTPKFDDSMSAAATTALNALSDGQAGLVEDMEAFLAASLEACGLAALHAKTLAAIERADGVAQRIKSQAANKPWYPKGYNEIRDGIAFRWVKNAGNDCYGCSYWTIDLIPRDGCPSSLYAELSIEKNGAAVGYTNDVLGRVRPGQRARLTFETYDDSAQNSQGSITEVNCY